MKVFIPVLTLLLFSNALGLSSSPEPEMDPFVGRKQLLFVTPSGRDPRPMLPLTPRKKNIICPKDYQTGFNVRCVVEPTPPKVVFRINGATYRTEKHEPFYLAGDYGGVVYRFNAKRSFSVGCTVGRRNVWAIVKLKC